jgi:hypothetical protein
MPLPLGDKIENEMGGACSVYGRRGEAIRSFDGETLRETDHAGDPDVDGRITKKRWIFRKWDVGV